jgi:hypothetical protein
MTDDYKQHRTTTLFAALDVLDGKVIGQYMARHRHQEFIRFLNRENPGWAGAPPRASPISWTPSTLPRRNQSKPQALHLDRRPRRHHRKGSARETGVRVDPL